MAKARDVNAAGVKEGVELLGGFNDFLIIGNVREGYLRYFIFLFHKTKTF